MYAKLNEQSQTIEYPPTNKDNICNYNLDTDLLAADGYVDIEQSLIDLFDEGKGKIENNAIVDISDTDEYKAKVKKQEIQAAKTIRNEAIDKITNSILIDQLLIKELDLKLAATTITQAEYDTAKAIYDARIVAKATQYVVAKETFYTTTGLIEPTIITV